MLERISQFGDLQTAFEQFRDPLHGFMVHLRQKRATQLREQLSGSASFDSTTFNRVVCHPESQNNWRERHITLQLFDKDNGQSRSVRKAVSFNLVRLWVELQVPPDVLGIYSYLPQQARA